MGNRFFFETFNVYKTALAVIVSIALAAHTTRAMLLQLIEIILNYFLSRSLAARWHSKGHDIPYHSVISFDCSRYYYGICRSENAA